MVLVFLAYGCKDDSSFTGNGKKAANNPIDGAQTDPQDQGNEGDDDDDDLNSGNPGIDEGCTENGTTVADLVTTTVENGSNGNYIEYNIKVENLCDDSKQSVESIQFDINGVVINQDASKALSYKILAQGTTLAQGVLQNVQGSDLFGNQGQNYFHNKTDQNIDLQAAKQGVTLRIDLNGIFYMKPGQQGQSTPAQSVILDTYLRFGSAEVITKEVPFQGEPSSDVLDSFNNNQTF